LYLSITQPTFVSQAQQAPTPIGCLIVKERCCISNEGAHYTEGKPSVKPFVKVFLQKTISTFPTSSCDDGEYFRDDDNYTLFTQSTTLHAAPLLGLSTTHKGVTKICGS
jgi:hypothetical protein